MAGRLLVGGVAWLAAVMLFAAALQWSARPTFHTHGQPTSVLARLLNGAIGGNSRSSWAVTSATGAHHALIIEVETDDVRSALSIAPDITAPVRGTYEEILIYVRAQGATDRLAARRVQWTPRGGYVELIIH